MKTVTAAALAPLALVLAACAHVEPTMNQSPANVPASPTPQDIRAVSPALEKYTQERLMGKVWKRPDLSARDRSLATVAALIARNQADEMPRHFRLALGCV